MRDRPERFSLDQWGKSQSANLMCASALEAALLSAMMIK
jgi:hypothetical protein